MYCPYCGIENKDENTYCNGCLKNMSNYVAGGGPFKLLCPHNGGNGEYHCNREHCQKFISCFKEELRSLNLLEFQSEYEQLKKEIEVGVKRRFAKEIKFTTNEEILKPIESTATISRVLLQTAAKSEPVKINKPV